MNDIFIHVSQGVPKIESEFLFHSILKSEADMRVIQRCQLNADSSWCSRFTGKTIWIYLH